MCSLFLALSLLCGPHAADPRPRPTPAEQKRLEKLKATEEYQTCIDEHDDLDEDEAADVCIAELE